MATKTPKVFSVGEGSEADFTHEQIELLVYKIRDWFISEECDRTYENPLEEAKAQVQQCLHALTKDGKIWHNAPDSFEGRIKVKTLYDMVEGHHVAQDRIKNPTAKEYAQHRENVESAKPKGADPATLQVYQENLEKDILQAYPELDTPVHKPNVMRLAMLYAEQERIRLDMPGASHNVRLQYIETLSTLQNAISNTMKALDIYPDQVRKRMDNQRKGSVGDLVALLGDDTDFKEREKRWALTLALQLWWMTKHPNGKNTGPQIHDFEMWHLTRTRPIQYTCKCGQEVTIVEGFTPEELRDYLVSEGVLVEKPLLPQLITENELHGLKAYGSTEPTHEDEGMHGSPDSPGDVGDTTDEGREFEDQ